MGLGVPETKTESLFTTITQKLVRYFFFFKINLLYCNSHGPRWISYLQPPIKQRLLCEILGNWSSLLSVSKHLPLRKHTINSGKWMRQSLAREDSLLLNAVSSSMKIFQLIFILIDSTITKSLPYTSSHMCFSRKQMEGELFGWLPM